MPVSLLDINLSCGLKNMLKVTSSILSCLLLSACFVGFSEQLVSPANALVQFNAQVITSITGKDLVENTAVRILNLETQKSILLIDDKTAAKYKTYKSFVSDMEWSRADRLSVTISDGDVDSTMLTFNPGTQKLISTKYLPPGGDFVQQEKLVKQIRSIFPKVNNEVLKSRIYRRQILAHGLVLIPGDLFDQGDNIWVFDISRKSVKKLLINQDPLAKSLLNEENRLKIVYSSGERTILMVYAHPSYERGNNPLYILENDRLRLSTAYQELYDVSIDFKGDRIAYCYWEKDKRHIVVKVLK
jgi:hypothetical protein